MTSYKKPLPAPDERTEGFWKAAKEHKLALQQCQRCRHFHHPPEIVCPHCQDPDPSFSFEPVSGRGTVRSWIVMRDAFLPGFQEEIPWINVVVELEEDKSLRMVARLADGPDAPIKLGAPVEVVFEDVTPEVTLPQFRLAR